MLDNLKKAELNRLFDQLSAECNHIGGQQDSSKIDGGEKQKWIQKVQENHANMKKIILILNADNVERKRYDDMLLAKEKQRLLKLTK